MGSPVGRRRSRRLAARNESWVEELSPEIQELIVQHLGVVSITRLCQVSRHWRQRAEASGWDSALPELDPLHLIGRPGFQKLHASLGSWELVARKLAGGNGACNCNYCDSCDQFFCLEAEFEFILPNRWVFDATVTAEVHGDGSQEDGQALREAIADAEPYATLLLSGAFLLDDELDLNKPIRLLGKEGEGASIRIWGDKIVVASAVLLKNLTIYTTHNEDVVEQHQSSVCLGGQCAFCDDHIYAQGGDGPIAPAIYVHAHELRPYLAHGLIAEDLTITSTIGSAVILGEGTCASFTRCAMHSHMSVCDDVTMCLGVMASSCSTLSMSECTLSRCRWGVFAGEDGMRLEKNNRFLDNEVEDITVDLYPDQPGIIVEPWRAGAANLPSRYTLSR